MEEKMEQQKREKTKLLIFIGIAYGLTYLMGLLMWYGSRKGYDLSVFPTAQMLYPAAGVILGLLVTNKREKKLPVGFFVTVLVTTAILVILALVSVFAPVDDIELQGMTIAVYNLISQYILIIGSVVALILLAVAGKEKRAEAGLTRRNWKSAVLVVLVFVGPHGARARWPALPARGARAQAGTARTGRARAGRHSPHGARARWPALCARMQGLPARAPVSLRARARRQGLPARAPVCCRLPARAAACTVCCRRPVGAGAAAAVRHYSRGRCLRSRRFSETFATLVPMKTLECKDILPTAYLSGLETSRSLFVRF